MLAKKSDRIVRSLKARNLVKQDLSQDLRNEIFVVDDDAAIGDLLNMAFSPEGFRVTSFGAGEEFYAAARSRAPPACVILDLVIPGSSGLDILNRIGAHNYAAPIIAMSAMGRVSTAVEAIRRGAVDFIEKPFVLSDIVVRVRKIIAAWVGVDITHNAAEMQAQFPCCQCLTQREGEVLVQIIGAASNKETAQRLGISPRTVEVHRAHILTKMGAKNTADLVRIALTGRHLVQKSAFAGPITEWRHRILLNKCRITHS